MRIVIGIIYSKDGKIVSGQTVITGDNISATTNSNGDLSVTDGTKVIAGLAKNRWLDFRIEDSDSEGTN